MFAFLDESCRDYHDLFLVAGALFTPRRAKRLEREWRKKFPEGFHARHINAAPISLRDRQRLEWAGEAIARDAEYVSCVMCSITDAERAFEGEAAAQGKAYLGCGFVSALPLARHLVDQRRPERIAYLYDRGRVDGQRRLNEVFELIQKDEEMRDEIYRLESKTEGETKSNPLLQVADFLAWEFGYWKTKTEPGGQMRASFNKLIVGLRRKEKLRKTRNGAFYYAFYTQSDLEHVNWWMGGLKNFVLRPGLEP